MVIPYSIVLPIYTKLYIMAYFKGQHRAVSACCWRKRSGWRVVLQAARRGHASWKSVLTQHDGVVLEHLAPYAAVTQQFLSLLGPCECPLFASLQCHAERRYALEAIDTTHIPHPFPYF